MPTMLTVYSLVPGATELYEEFMSQRKIAYISSLPGVKRFEVFQRGRRLEPEAPNVALPYDIVAVIDVDDIAAAQAVRAGDEYRAFLDEYVELIHPQACIYEAKRIERKAALSADEFWNSSASKSRANLSPRAGIRN